MHAVGKDGCSGWHAHPRGSDSENQIRISPPADLGTTILKAHCCLPSSDKYYTFGYQTNLSSPKHSTHFLNSMTKYIFRKQKQKSWQKPLVILTWSTQHSFDGSGCQCVFSFYNKFVAIRRYQLHIHGIWAFAATVGFLFPVCQTQGERWVAYRSHYNHSVQQEWKLPPLADIQPFPVMLIYCLPR